MVRKAGLRGDLNSIRALKSTIRRMPVTVAHDVAQRAAPELTSNTQAAFNSNTTVYGAPRPRSVDGSPLTLTRTGTVQRMLAFVANGSVVRAVLGTRYARYLVGKYDILPNGPLPHAWREDLRRIVKETKKPEVRQ